VTDIAGERARLAAQGLEIITREQWVAHQDYTSDRAVNRPAQWLFLHITVTDDPADTTNAEAAACRQVEEIGQERFGIGWSYNAGVMQSGRLYEGQPLTRRGAHTVNDKPNPNFPTGTLNYDARALALVQNVQDAVTDAQIDSAARWGAALRRSGEAIANADWFGHRDVTAKSCPGDIAYARLGELNSLTDYYTQYGLVPVTPPEDLMELGTFTLSNPNGSFWLVYPRERVAFQVDGDAKAKLAADPNVSEFAFTQASTDTILRVMTAYGLNGEIWPPQVSVLEPAG